MAEKYKDHYPDPSEAPAIDIMPASNGEFIPPDPTPAQRKIMALQNEKAQAGQQEMLKQLRDVSEAIRASRSLDWNPVKFQLTEETAEGPPAVGVLISFNQRERPIRGAGCCPGASTRAYAASSPPLRPATCTVPGSRSSPSTSW